MTPYLEPPLRDRFDAWLHAAIARYSPPLEFAEIRKGAQALSSLWVERRAAGALAARAIRGQGKRAAIATYFAPLHFLTVHHALDELYPGRTLRIRRLLDLGCGTGATGAAIASSAEKPCPLSAVDVSGWALGEAEATWVAFEIEGRKRRGALPRALPRAGAGDLIALGWVVNELAAAARLTLDMMYHGAALDDIVERLKTVEKLQLSEQNG